MTRIAKAVAMAGFAVLLGAAGPAESPVDVPEPAKLYDGPQHGYTPPTLRGASVIDLAGLERLMGQETPVLLDVGPADRKPENLPPGTIWLPSHRTIPGSVWMPNAGAVPLTAEQERAFVTRVDTLTGGDKTKPVVTFCHPECWGSWNIGKRLVAAGYTQVHWFPLGIEGWQDAHETAPVRQDPAWAAVTPMEQRQDAEPQR